MILENVSREWQITPGYIYLLTAWSAVLLEKLPRSHLVKFTAFYGTRRFITAFASARHLPLSWATLIPAMPSPPTSWRSVLILSSHLRMGLPSGLSLRFPHQNPLYASALPYTCYMTRPPRSSLFDRPRVHNYIHLLLIAVSTICDVKC